MRTTIQCALLLAFSCGCAWGQAPALEAPLDWQPLTPPGGYAQCFLPHPDDENLWFVCSNAGFYVSNNAGATYRRLGATFCTDVAVDPTNSNRVVFVCSTEGVYISEDRGNNWTLRKPSSVENMISVHISPRDGTILVAPRNSASQHGVFRSVDHGLTFQFYSFGTTHKNLIVWDLYEDPDTGTFYAGTEIADHPQPYKPPLFRSLNRGQSWEEISGIITWHVVSFAYDSVAKQMLALTEGAGLYRSGDQGSTWVQVSFGPSTQILRDPKSTSRLWATRQTTGFANAQPSRDSVLFSPDMGASWYLAGLADRNTIIQFNKTGTKLYASTFPASLFTAPAQPTPRLNFTSLSAVDGASVSFACNPIKMFDAVKLTVDAQLLPMTRAVNTAAFPISGVTCSFAVPPGTAAGDHAAKLELDGVTLPFTLKVTKGTAAFATAMTTVLFTTPEKFAPGDIVSVFGVRLSRPSSTVGPSNLASPPFPNTLNQSRAFVISPSSNISFTTPVQLSFTDAATGASQINLQLPTNLADGQYTLRVDRLTDTGQLDSFSPSLNFTVGSYQPLFLGNATYPVFLQNITQDPLGGVFATAARHARPGDVLTLYATGMGITNPRLNAGTVPTVLTRIVAQPQNSLLTAGGRVTPIDPIGGVIVASPQFPGLYQMSIQLPANLDTSQGVVLRHELGAVRVDIPIPVIR